MDCTCCLETDGTCRCERCHSLAVAPLMRVPAKDATEHYLAQSDEDLRRTLDQSRMYLRRDPRDAGAARARDLALWALATRTVRAA